MKKAIFLTTILSFSSLAYDGVELNKEGLDKGNVSGLEIDYKSCTVYQGKNELKGEVIYCNQADNLTVMYPSENCNTIANYQLFSGESYLTQFRFACEAYIRAGVSASILDRID
ncbi:hypothetical protein O1O06_14125 [Grimontia hollisae]|uniref:hypothetical protein n=1 Tax=Grimontia hollisae TaxID=673 RepID=UPI0023DA80D1|nr:hypothetical protein [Grimontia hollisae]MDF2185887.1 hypothetical protein [Grimontia hollisae]